MRERKISRRSPLLSRNSGAGMRMRPAALPRLPAQLWHTTYDAVRDRAGISWDLPRILDAMDQPTIDGLNTWFVSKAARSSV